MKKIFFVLLLLILPHAALAAGSIGYTTPGYYGFTVPLYGTITVYVYGGGGGGGSGYNLGNPLYDPVGNPTGFPDVGNGQPGGTSWFGGWVAATGGQGGWSAWTGWLSAPAAGTGSGGDSNVYGGGAAGGANGAPDQCSDFGNPFGPTHYYPTYGATGGGASRTFSQGQIAPGSGIGITVGGGGGGAVATGVDRSQTEDGMSGSCNAGNGSDGSAGAVYIYWTDPPPASCTVSLTPNPASYSNSSTATLSWTSSNADSYTHINNAGNFTGSSGSFTVPRTATTDYSCTAYGTGGSDGAHAYTLTVTNPATPTASITSSRGTTMQLGQSSTITATFSAVSGDPITHDNIDSPLGNGVGADTDPGTKTYTFTPVSAGTYAFYARAQTSYYTSWTTYNTYTITVAAPCTLGSTTIQSGDSATFYSSQISPSGQLCSSVSQTRTCTNGVLSGSASYQYASCTCAPLYSCSGSNVTYTDNNCSVTTVASCVSPAFCSAGISSCQLPAPSFNAGTGTTGHIQAKPQVLSPGKSATVSWNVSNVSACSVSGSNGDSWTGASGSKTTSAITQRTVFTLNCTGLDASKISESAVVNVTPTFQEQ